MSDSSSNIGGEAPQPDFSFLGSGQASEPPVDPDSLANPFLSRIPEVDRKVVEKYVKDWDAGVTRKFQDIHRQYAPFRTIMQQNNIQDPAIFGQAWNLYDYVNNDPEGFLHMVAKEMGFQLTPLQAQEIAEAGGMNDGQQQNPPSGFPPEWDSRLTQIEQAVANIGQYFQSQQQSAQQQMEDQQLDGLLQQMHAQLGDFDEEYVMTKMLQGQTPQQAYQSYQQLAQGIVNNSRRPVPPVLNGANSGIPTPGNGRRTPADSRKLAAQMLQATIDQQG